MSLKCGNWTVVPGREKRDSAGRKKVFCACSCGSKPKYIDQYNLTSGKTKSCGCLRSEKSKKRLTSHGMSDSAEYKIWSNVIQRCTNKNRNVYNIYGGAGIKICDRWRNSFEAFLEDVGPRPSRHHSIDRWPDQNGNYEPGNVLWATAKQQAQNRSRSIMISRKGQTKCLSAWCEHLNIPYSRTLARIRKGWDLESALTKPSMTRTNPHA